MRKQQWEMASGGLADGRSSEACTQALRTAGCAAGTIVNTAPKSAAAATWAGWPWSRDPWAAWQCAWHKPGCSSSIAWDMLSAQGIPASAICAISKAFAGPWHAYAASAPCANSSAHSDRTTVTSRQRRCTFSEDQGVAGTGRF